MQHEMRKKHLILKTAKTHLLRTYHKSAFQQNLKKFKFLEKLIFLKRISLRNLIKPVTYFEDRSTFYILFSGSSKKANSWINSANRVKNLKTALSDWKRNYVRADDKSTQKMFSEPQSLRFFEKNLKEISEFYSNSETPEEFEIAEIRIEHFVILGSEGRTLVGELPILLDNLLVNIDQKMLFKELNPLTAPTPSKHALEVCSQWKRVRRTRERTRTASIQLLKVLHQIMTFTCKKLFISFVTFINSGIFSMSKTEDFGHLICVKTMDWFKEVRLCLVGGNGREFSVLGLLGEEFSEAVWSLGESGGAGDGLVPTLESALIGVNETSRMKDELIFQLNESIKQVSLPKLPKNLLFSNFDFFHFLRGE